MFKTYNKIINQIITQSDENQSFRVERPLGVCPNLNWILEEPLGAIAHSSFITRPVVSVAHWLMLSSNQYRYNEQFELESATCKQQYLTNSNQQGVKTKNCKCQTYNVFSNGCIYILFWTILLIWMLSTKNGIVCFMVWRMLKLFFLEIWLIRTAIWTKCFFGFVFLQINTAAIHWV